MKPKPTDTLHPIFRECCGTENSRYALTVPFASAGHVCATNGRILVRRKLDAPEDDAPDAPPVGNLKIDEVANRCVNQCSVYSAEESSSAPHTSCDACEGTLCVVACPECKGSGSMSCPNCQCRLDEVTCGECNGCGYELRPAGEVESLPCPFCQKIPCDVGHGYLVAARYLWLLRRHGARLWCDDAPKKNRALYFRVNDDIDGLLMPVATNKVAPTYEPPKPAATT